MFLTKLKLGTAAVLCACLIGGSFISLGIAQDAKPENENAIALTGQDNRLPGTKKSVPFPIEINHTKNGVEVKGESFRAVSHTCTVDVGKQSLVLRGKAGQPVVLFRVPGADPGGQSKQLTGMTITVNLADGSFQVEGAKNLK